VSNSWIVVADSTRARILRLEHRALTELEDLVHPASRTPDHDLVSDRGGRTFDSSRQGGRHAMEPQHTPKQVETDTFARELAQRLDAARAKGEFDELILIAAPQFLGQLSAHLDEVTRRLVTRRIHKHLARHSLDDVASTLGLPRS
jgi:protein required for attachment to host cells